MKTTYEWVVEQMDGDEIVDTSAFDTLGEAMEFAEPGNVISLRRDVGDDEQGIIDRQYAYPGDHGFDDGATIPQRLMAAFLSVPAEFRATSTAASLRAIAGTSQEQEG